jgi:hypothetical protein
MGGAVIEETCSSAQKSESLLEKNHYHTTLISFVRKQVSKLKKAILKRLFTVRDVQAAQE